MLEPVEKDMRPRLASSVVCACMPCIRCTCTHGDTIRTQVGQHSKLTTTAMREAASVEGSNHSVECPAVNCSQGQAIVPCVAACAHGTAHCAGAQMCITSGGKRRSRAVQVLATMVAEVAMPHRLMQRTAGGSRCQSLVSGEAVQDDLQQRLRQGEQPTRLVLRKTALEVATHSINEVRYSARWTPIAGER